MLFLHNSSSSSSVPGPGSSLASSCCLSCYGVISCCSLSSAALRGPAGKAAPHMCMIKADTAPCLRLLMMLFLSYFTAGNSAVSLDASHITRNSSICAKKNAHTQVTARTAPAQPPAHATLTFTATHVAHLLALPALPPAAAAALPPAPPCAAAAPPAASASAACWPVHARRCCCFSPVATCCGMFHWRLGSVV
jgi:hypothetical protein